MALFRAKENFSTPPFVLGYQHYRGDHHHCLCHYPERPGAHCRPNIWHFYLQPKSYFTLHLCKTKIQNFIEIKYNEKDLHRKNRPGKLFMARFAYIGHGTFI